MKLLHLSDLHIGKKLKEYSMLDEQKYILSRICDICDEKDIECVVIAGDVYDKSVPPTEAVQAFDEFIYRLYAKKIPVLIISGNHDSPERLSFGGRVMTAGGIHIVPAYNGEVNTVTLNDKFGEVIFHLLPFVKPVNVRRFFSDKNIESCNDAVAAILGDIRLDESKRNVLVAHQFVTGSQLSQSEELYIGGEENIDGRLFSAFDYAALGHIHRPQYVGDKKIRYCGSLLKYHIEEANREKTITIAEIGEKGDLKIEELPVTPLHDVRSYKGSFEKLTDKTFYANVNTDDYVYITLTDEADVPDAARKLKKIYPNLLQLLYDNSRTAAAGTIKMTAVPEKQPPISIFSDFFEMQCLHKMSDEQNEVMQSLIKSVWEEEIE